MLMKNENLNDLVVQSHCHVPIDVTAFQTFHLRILFVGDFSFVHVFHSISIHQRSDQLKVCNSIPCQSVCTANKMIIRVVVRCEANITMLFRS